jgi:hypothetical protein
MPMTLIRRHSFGGAGVSISLLSGWGGLVFQILRQCTLKIQLAMTIRSTSYAFVEPTLLCPSCCSAWQLGAGKQWTALG